MLASLFAVFSVSVSVHLPLYLRLIHLFRVITLLPCLCAIQLHSCLPAAHLPGLTAPPAGVGGDVQTPTARLPGQEGELPYSTADEAPQVDSRGLRLERDPQEQTA